MINRHTLANGLRIVHYEDHTTQMVAVNVLYNVGARNEDPEHTGYAHLLEHLMFSGSVHIPNYDTHVQLAGGENNAWTNNDFTDYYITLPRCNVETAFWLESDRMTGLILNAKNVKVQKDVVIEEFKQQHLNRPYGDVHHLIRNLAYKVHPYRWPTIGISTEHIAKATRKDVMDFYYRHYGPANAILSVVGGIPFDEVVRLSEKWFGPIQPSSPEAKGEDDAPCPIPTKGITEELVAEPQQTRLRRKIVYRNVPADMLVMAFHMDKRKSREYDICDIITDLLAAGQSSRLIRKLIHKHKLFTSINAYIQGSIDEGLLYVMGRPTEDTTLEQAEKAVWDELNLLKHTATSNQELSKVRNRSESERIFSYMSYLNRAIAIAQMEAVGQDQELEDELERYSSITAEEIRQTARKLFKKKNCSILYYKSTQKHHHDKVVYAEKERKNV